MKIRLTALLLALSMLAFVPTLGMAADDNPQFSDIADHKYEAEILYCAELGFVKGVGNGRFEPDGTLSREQFATVWARTLQFADDNHTFADVSPLSRYSDTSIIVLFSKGIVQGVSDTRYAVNEKINREQLALITKRTYNLGVINPNAYEIFTDSQAVSEWAREGVNACLHNGLLNGLYNGDTLQPQKAVTRGELCKLIYNINRPAYSITIGETEGGTLASDHIVAREGVVVTLTATPDTGNRLVTFMVNGEVIGGNTFAMPARDVVVTATFEEAPVLTDITIGEQPENGTEFDEGDPLSLDGLTVIAHYANHDERDVTNECTFDPEIGALLTVDDTEVLISYTEDGETKTTTLTITVNAAADPSEEPTGEPE